MKRVMLLIGTNLAIMLVLGIVSTLTGAHKFFTGAGLDLGRLLLFAGLMGFGGAFLSLWMSKTIAKWSTGAQVIDVPQNATEAWLVETVRRISQKAGLPTPEVAIYEGEPNAFATGASRNSSLVAVSTVHESKFRSPFSRFSLGERPVGLITFTSLDSEVNVEVCAGAQ